MAARSLKVGLLIGAAVMTPGLIAGCGCEDASNADATGAGGSGASGEGGSLFPTGTGGGGTGGDGPCVGLECQQVVCGGGTTTAVTGRVYDPAGKVPLYNVVVYVPNTPLAPIVDGASCDQCGTLSGSPIVTALTNTEGRFVLENVPVGDNIPLVIQVGKWRREFTLPKVERCVENPTVDTSIRLPRNKSEGHIPKIALTTGGWDPLECLLKKVGISEEEFTNPDGDGRVNLYVGEDGTDRYVDDLNGGADFEPATGLWATSASLRRYDIVLLACEGEQYPEKKPAAARAAMLEYTSQGGRVFASHWHNIWLQHGPPAFQSVATWDPQDDPENAFYGTIDTSFPKGQALADWLVNVQASTTPGKLRIFEPQHTIDTVNAEVARQWIYSEAPMIPGIQYFSFNTPVGVPEEQQCGRMVYSDIHVSANGGSDPDQSGAPFPSECRSQDLSAQEKALLFMLFDLSACLISDDEVPEPPPPE